MSKQKVTGDIQNTPLVISPGDLVGSRGAASILGITVASVVRRVQRGTLIPLVRLDHRGAYVFARFEIEAEAAK